MGTGRGSGHIILGTSQVTGSGSQPKVSSGENLGPEKVGPQSKGCTLAVSTQQWHPRSHPPTCHSSWSQFFLSSFCPKVSLLSPCSGTAPTQAHLPRPPAGPTALPGSQTQHPSLSLGWAQRAGVERGTAATEEGAPGPLWHIHGHSPPSTLTPSNYMPSNYPKRALTPVWPPESLHTAVPQSPQPDSP